MQPKRSLSLLLAASLLTGGCAQFMVPTTTSAVYSAAERDAFYKMVNTGVKDAVIGFTLMYLVSQIVERPIPEETIREKWVPAGVRAFVEHLYVDSKAKREHWKFTGEAIYEANFSRTNNTRLYDPAANLASFCSVSGGSFRLTKRDDTQYQRASDLRPAEGLAHWADYPAVDVFRAADAAVAVIEAQEGGAWGFFSCTRPDGTQAWWARVGPALQAKKNHGPSFAVDIGVVVHETPYMAFPPTNRAMLYKERDTVIHQAFKSSKPVRKEVHDVVIDVWSKSRSTDRFGCREMLSTITYGDRILNSQRDVVCL